MSAPKRKGKAFVVKGSLAFAVQQDTFLAFLDRQSRAKARRADEDNHTVEVEVHIPDYLVEDLYFELEARRFSQRRNDRTPTMTPGIGVV